MFRADPSMSICLPLCCVLCVGLRAARPHFVNVLSIVGTRFIASVVLSGLCCDGDAINRVRTSLCCRAVILSQPLPLGCVGANNYSPLHRARLVCRSNAAQNLFERRSTAILPVICPRTAAAIRAAAMLIARLMGCPLGGGSWMPEARSCVLACISRSTTRST